MSTPYVGQLMLASFNFAPRGYALCNGQMMAVNQNQALFSLLGVTYGGNGMQTFALPNLQGRAPMHVGNGFQYGEIGGEEMHTITSAETPTHTHLASAITSANAADPAGAFLGGNGAPVFNSLANAAAMNPAAISSFGGSQSHENRTPYLVMNWVIALTGVFPSRS
jgi:microcystin-dependent protein